MGTMSTGEKWMYRVIAVAFFALFIVMAIGHRPSGG
jgi:hypothetical protein